MPCTCGDIQCPFCGPFQWKCPICREWASIGCKHINPETGDLFSQYQEEAWKITRAEIDADYMLQDIFDEGVK